MKTGRILLCLLIALPVLLGACAPQATELNGSARDAVLAYSEGKTDNLMQGLNNNDYAAVSRDFDDTMKKAVPQSALADMQTKVIAVIGKYVSREVSSVQDTGDNVVVVYNAKFEQEDNVTLRVVFTKDDAHKVSGLWFDSPKLRGK